MTRRMLEAALPLLLLVGCARPYPPPGGETPNVPPFVVATVPEPLAVEAGGVRGAAVIRFDRRLSEQLPANPVIVSPATGEVQVSRGRSELRVTVSGGWRADQIYRVVVLPGVRDLFGNVTTEPIELVFSTGPEIPATAIAGLVTERLTGRAARQAVVEAVRRADSVTYTAPADTGGFFAIRYVPPGEYDVRAFADLNRNRRLDPSEPVATSQLASLRSSTDTVSLFFGVLVPDTTPARLLRAELVDSLHIRLTFDDAIDQEADLGTVRVQLVALPDSVPGPPVTPYTPAHYAVLQRALEAARDTLPPPPARPQEPPLPARELELVAATPLRPGASYLVRVQGVVNVHGVPGGGGEATITVPPRGDDRDDSGGG